MGDFDYEKYERNCKKIREANARLLDEFDAWLKSSGLAKKTINNHHSNIDFYVNTFLLYEDAIEAKEGVGSVDTFLGDWVIRKTVWSSPSSIKSYAASLKKFYTFMYEQELIDQKALDELKQTIKEEMPEWLESVECYNDPLIDDFW